MESFGPWKLIKAGFWVGIGFIIPSIAVYFFGTFLMFAAPSLWQSAAMEAADDGMAQYMADKDKTNLIEITGIRETRNGKQLLILGTVENTGEGQVSAIQLEAELLDDEQLMVYECSEYISKKLPTGEKENFQIKCGCSEQGVPDYASVSVRVVSASDY